MSIAAVSWAVDLYGLRYSFEFTAHGSCSFGHRPLTDYSILRNLLPMAAARLGGSPLRTTAFFGIYCPWQPLVWAVAPYGLKHSLMLSAYGSRLFGHRSLTDYSILLNLLPMAAARLGGSPLRTTAFCNIYCPRHVMNR